MKSLQILQKYFWLICLLTTIFGCQEKEEVTPAVRAGFDYSPKTNLVAPVTIYFENTSENSQSYLWTIGSNFTDTDKDLAVEFTKAGTYTVVLEATGKSGSDTYSERITIIDPVSANPNPPASTQKPIANFSFSPSQGLQAPVKVNFKNESLYAETYQWQVSGSGVSFTAIDKDLLYDFKTAGTYTVKLTATGKGGTSEVSKSVVVNQPVSNFKAPGQAVFWATGTWERVTVELGAVTYQQAANGPFFASLTFGTLNQKTTVAPTCGAKDFFTTERPANTYQYKATAYNGTQKIAELNGTYVVESNKCTTVRIDFANTGGSGGNTGGGGPSGGGNTGQNPPQGIPNNTTFVSKYDVFSAKGAYWLQEFTVNTATTFVLRLAAQYKLQAGIFPISQMAAFQNGSQVSGNAIFDDTYGIRAVTLAPGKYFVGIRNNVSGANSYALELDYGIRLPAPATRTQTESVAESLTKGQWKSYKITTTTSSRIFVDGCNSGIDVYLVDESNYTKFQNNQSFQYLVGEFSGEQNKNTPGFAEIPNTGRIYYLVMSNRRGATGHSFTFTYEAWR